MDLSELKQTLAANAALRRAAGEADAGALLGDADAAALEQAVRDGDTAALRRALDRVLSTPEGRALAARVQKAVGRDG